MKTTVVAVTGEPQRLLDRVCTVLSGAGFATITEPGKGSKSEANGHGEPACMVALVAKADRSTVARIGAIRSQFGAPKAVLVCQRVGDTEIRRALENGIDGVMVVEDLERGLLPVIAAVCAGQVSAPERQRRELRPRFLTTREKQILSLVVMGMTNGQIANKLFLAESTVKSHLSSAFDKLSVSSRNEAVSLILDPDRGRGLGILTIPAERVPSPT